ncbi:MAG: molybdopterin-dependent oxidoreductase [Gammaproteobacteria bacterium]|nr:molybdopterin-dependent oxidoreductase [Gammaproteobacteria bacterium]
MNDESVATVRTMCPMNCHPTLCGMQVKVAGNKLLDVAGDPDNPDSRGFLCLRGRAAREIIGNPQRILHPLIRQQRGSQDWREIGWDEAMSLIADKLGAIDSAEFGIWLGHGDAATNYGTRIGGLLSRRFAHLYGCQWWHPAMICWGLGGFGLGLTGVLNVHTKEDMAANARLIILWGANIASQPNTSPHLKTARARGARVITIDIRDSEATARADQSIRIKPGSDAALALAMMQVIVAEGLVDRAFVDKHTVGYDALREHLQTCTPDWASEHTRIDPDTIHALAREYATSDPAMIVLGGSSMHKSANGWQAPRAVACLPALTGNLGKPGAGFGPRHGASTHGQALNSVLPDQGSRCANVIPNQMSSMVDAFASGKVKALLLSGTNMLSSFADTGALAKSLAGVDLVVCHELFSNDTIRQHADIVLPGTAWLEQLGCKMTNTHLYFMEQALAPPGDTHNLSGLLRDLAQRLGVSGFFPWDGDEGLLDAVLDHPATGNATVAKMRATGGMRALDISHHAYPDHRYATPSGKVEFYSQRAADHGLAPLPVFEPVGRSADCPLQFRQGRTLTHFHGFYDHGQALPSLRKRNTTAWLWLSPADAASRGIRDGAAVRIFNQRGEFTAHAYVTPKMQDGAVWMRDGWAGINRLTSGAPVIPDAAVDTFAFSAGQAAFDALVEVEPVNS